MFNFLVSCIVTYSGTQNNSFRFIDVYAKFDHQMLTQSDIENLKTRIHDEIAKENEEHEEDVDFFVTVLNLVEIAADKD